MRVLGDIVARQGRRLGDRTALIDAVTDRRYSFRELAERSARIANGLRSLGVGPGDRVAMLLGNSPVCAELPFGITLYEERYTSPIQTESLPARRRDAVTGHDLRSREDAVSLVEEIEESQGIAK